MEQEMEAGHEEYLAVLFFSPIIFNKIMPQLISFLSTSKHSQLLISVSVWGLWYCL